MSCVVMICMTACQSTHSLLAGQVTAEAKSSEQPPTQLLPQSPVTPAVDAATQTLKTAPDMAQIVAAEWAEGERKAAEEGSASAQFNLGELYEHGLGVPQNFVEAYKWLSLTATQGDRDSVRFRDQLVRKAENTAILPPIPGTLMTPPTTLFIASTNTHKISKWCAKKQLPPD